MDRHSFVNDDDLALLGLLDESTDGADPDADLTDEELLDDIFGPDPIDWEDGDIPCPASPDEEVEVPLDKTNVG